MASPSYVHRAAGPDYGGEHPKHFIQFLLVSATCTQIFHRSDSPGHPCHYHSRSSEVAYTRELGHPLHSACIGPQSTSSHPCHRCPPHSFLGFQGTEPCWDNDWLCVSQCPDLVQVHLRLAGPAAKLPTRSSFPQPPGWPLHSSVPANGSDFNLLTPVVRAANENKHRGPCSWFPPPGRKVPEASQR